ncbi:endonuclease/exonuclease/phosphatase family protein [Puteibacter caeruleilacunae]|nr:endonuclease/exonuclease/phosphatase family protein [Puteibacter caeruleilacunae]
MRILSIVIACFILASCSVKKEKDTTQLKVMVWNILHGGKNKDLPVDGRPDVISIIKETKADVILMIETYGAAPMIADSLGYHHELLSSNLCVYSKYPITKKMVFPDQISTFNFGGVQISVNGQPVNVFDTWLHYLPDTRLAPTDKSEAEILAWENEGSRDDEVFKILDAIKPYLHDSIPVLMGGDFNSHSHLDWTDATKNMYNHGGAVVNWTVSKAMTDAGFEDTFRKIHPDPVKNIGTTWLAAGGKDGNLVFNRRDRIDYLYKKGSALKVIDSKSYNAPFSQHFKIGTKEYDHFPSDHGFVVTTFELE